VSTNPTPEEYAAVERHNQLAREIITQITGQRTGFGSSPADVLMLCESILVGVTLECFQAGTDVQVLEILLARVKERLAGVRLKNMEVQGRG